MRIIKTAVPWFILLSFSVSVLADAQSNKAFRDTVNNAIKEECIQKDDNERHRCWIDKSPEKCQGFAIESDSVQWAKCIQSCGSANWFSRTFGECSL